MDEKPTNPYAAAAGLAQVVGIQAGLMGGVLGCCYAVLILMLGFIVGLFLFLNHDPKHGDKDHPRNPPAHESK